MPTGENSSGDRFRGAIVRSPKSGPFDTLPDGMQYISSCHSNTKVFAYAFMAQRLSWWNKIFPGSDIEPIHGLFAENAEYVESSGGAYTALGEVPRSVGQKRKFGPSSREILKLLVEDSVSAKKGAMDLVSERLKNLESAHFELEQKVESLAAENSALSKKNKKLWLEVLKLSDDNETLTEKIDVLEAGSVHLMKNFKELDHKTNLLTMRNSLSSSNSRGSNAVS